jgi:hypothetical protein
MYRPILREQRIKIFTVKSMRMRTLRGQNHEIGNVDDTDAEVGCNFAQECSGCNHFERDFYADPYEYAT